MALLVADAYADLNPDGQPDLDHRQPRLASERRRARTQWPG